MTTALAPPSFAGLVTHWQLGPVALVAALALAGWYARGRRRLLAQGRRWPAGRTATFAGGLLLFVWTTNGWAEAYRSSLYWAWAAQTLTLLLVVPLLLLQGHPLQLARELSGESGYLSRALRSRPVRVLGNPLVGPALVPLLTVALFFGPVPGWSVAIAPVGWSIQLLTVLAGGLVVLPFVGLEDAPSSLAVGLSLAIGSLELVIDALPGIVLRLSNSLVTPYFDHRHQHPWSPSALRDQHIAGSIVWTVSEVIDLPFLLLAFRRWVRADAREASRIDAVLEAERIATGRTGAPDEPAADAPWWLTDEQMKRRLH